MEIAVDSIGDLARRLGRSIWVPAQWPYDVGAPLVLLLIRRNQREDQGSYQLRAQDRAGRWLIVFGQPHDARAILESGLQAVQGLRFVTWSRPEGEPAHVVAEAPGFDVHVLGSAISREIALSVSRQLVEVKP